MTKRRLVAGLVATAVLVALAAGWAVSQSSGRTSVTTATASTQTLALRVTAPGRLEAPTAVTVAAPTSGTLASVAVRDGQQVPAGQVLATLDAAPLDLAVAQAQAQASAARAMPTGTDRLNTARTHAIAAADAALAQARDHRARAELKAPAAGTVSLMSLSLMPGGAPVYQTQAGASVSPGLALFTIVDAASVRFAAQVDEADIAGVQVGQQAEITLDAFPQRTFTGTVDLVRPTAQTTSTGGIAFGVLVALAPSDARLFTGMTGDAALELSAVPDALVVPAQAVVTEGGKRSVWKVVDGRVTKVAVSVGATSDTLVQLTAGVAAGDIVATSPLSALKERDAVHVR